jgi:hypothetical protein
VDPNNPRLIEPGQVLRIPELGDSRFYAVKAGDDLTSIASNPQVYNDPNQWTRSMNRTGTVCPTPKTRTCFMRALFWKFPGLKQLDRAHYPCEKFFRLKAAPFPKGMADYRHHNPNSIGKAAGWGQFKEIIAKVFRKEPKGPG